MGASCEEANVCSIMLPLLSKFALLELDLESSFISCTDKLWSNDLSWGIILFSMNGMNWKQIITVK